MSPKSLGLLAFIVILTTLIIVIAFIGLELTGKLQTTTPSTATTAREQTTTTTSGEQPTFRRIQGLGFKAGAWAVYNVTGYEKKEDQLTVGIGIHGTVSVKMFYFDVAGKGIRGLEMTLGNGTTLILFWDEEGRYYSGILYPPGFCVGLTGEVVFGAGYLTYKKENLKEEYVVEDRLEFVGRGMFKTVSGREVEVLMFKAVTHTGMEYEKGKEYIIEEEYWFSPQVPTYFVYGKRVEAGVLHFEGLLLDFGLEGAQLKVTQRDIENCIKGVFPINITEITQTPSLVNKLYCEKDEDCACGVDKETGQCAIGNKKYIDITRQCPDFCTGIGGYLKIVCKNNTCMFELKEITQNKSK